ncbi:4-hydroxy-tetrahydrodipicolinate reductase [Chloroflexota bacterium]
MKPISVVVYGADGKVGRVIIAGLCGEPDIKLAGAVDVRAEQDKLPLPDGSGTIPFSADLDCILTTCQPDVMVDFTVAHATMPAVRIAVKHGVNLVIGTSGITEDNLGEISNLAQANKVGAVVASNFALGAVLMMHLANLAAKYLDYAEIIELHHNTKVDSPSGTAKTTAQAMAAARGKPFLRPPSEKGETPLSRGEQVEGVNIHSVRLPGLSAHQEVILAGAGQTLSIRHDTINRECYLPGIILAIKEVVKKRGLVYGLDTLLGLTEK